MARPKRRTTGVLEAYEEAYACDPLSLDQGQERDSRESLGERRALEQRLEHQRLEH